MNITLFFSKEMFKGKTVFITGGGSGINLGVVTQYGLQVVGKPRASGYAMHVSRSASCPSIHTS
jgi:hypothetical protein